MNKQSIINLIITQLEANISVAQQAVEVSRDTATHKDCLGSSKYETMGTEASYLAKGQGERLLELQRALGYFKQLQPKITTCVTLTSLLSTEDEQGKIQTLLLAADAGGLKVEHKGKTITIITPQSPLGKKLMGKQLNDDFELNIAGKKACYKVIRVS